MKKLMTAFFLLSISSTSFARMFTVEERAVIKECIAIATEVKRINMEEYNKIKSSGDPKAAQVLESMTASNWQFDSSLESCIKDRSE